MWCRISGYGGCHEETVEETIECQSYIKERRLRLKVGASVFPGFKNIRQTGIQPVPDRDCA